MCVAVDRQPAVIVNLSSVPTVQRSENGFAVIFENSFVGECAVVTAERRIFIYRCCTSRRGVIRDKIVARSDSQFSAVGKIDFRGLTLIKRRVFNTKTAQDQLSTGAHGSNNFFS